MATCNRGGLSLGDVLLFHSVGMSLAKRWCTLYIEQDIFTPQLTDVQLTGSIRIGSRVVRVEVQVLHQNGL